MQVPGVGVPADQRPGRRSPAGGWCCWSGTPARPAAGSARAGSGWCRTPSTWSAPCAGTPGPLVLYSCTSSRSVCSPPTRPGRPPRAPARPAASSDASAIVNRMFSLPVTRLNSLTSSSVTLPLGAGADPVHRGDQQLHQRVGDLALPAVQQRRQQRQRQRLGGWSRRCDWATRPPPGPASRPAPSARRRRTARPAGRPRGPPRSLAISVSIVSRLTLPGSDLINANTVGPSPSSPSSPSSVGVTRVRRRARTDFGQPGSHLREQQLLTPVQRRPDDPVETSARRRLDALFPAPRQQLLAHPVPRPARPG